MLDYSNIQELYNALIPAFNVKLRMLKYRNYDDIKRKDIWEYLSNTKWIHSVDLSISQMVSDIINVDEYKIKKYMVK